jgi:hypothetical protein
MKALLFALVIVALCAPARSQQEVPLTDVVGSNNSFNDSVFGISLTYPAGWEVLGGFRWGKDNGENTFRFRPLWPSEARPSLYYQRFSADHPRPSDINVWFRESSRKKEESRSGGGGDYKNVPESFVFKTTTGGLPSFSYLATFTARKTPMAEYFVRVAGQQGYVMFFTQGTLDDINAIRPEIDAMADTVRVP